MDNIGRIHGLRRLIVGFRQVEGDGRQHGRIVAGNHDASVIGVTRLTYIDHVGLCIADRAHEPERGAAISVYWRPPCPTAFGIERRAEPTGRIVAAVAVAEAKLNGQWR